MRDCCADATSNNFIVSDAIGLPGMFISTIAKVVVNWVCLGRRLTRLLSSFIPIASKSLWLCTKAGKLLPRRMIWGYHNTWGLFYDDRWECRSNDRPCTNFMIMGEYILSPACHYKKSQDIKGKVRRIGHSCFCRRSTTRQKKDARKSHRAAAGISSRSVPCPCLWLLCSD